MTPPIYPLTLTKPEARLCREAVKWARMHTDRKDAPLLDHGEQRLTRGDWFELQRWLTWTADDFEKERELSERKAMEALSRRIEAFHGRLPCEELEAVVAPGTQLALF